MSNGRWLCRFLLLVLLNSLVTTGCDLMDKGESYHWGDAGPATPSGYSIDVSGGAGTVGTGGDGDQETGIWLDSYGPLGVKVYGSGAADASFAVDLPAAAPELGTEPLTVTADTTVPVYDAHPADNNVYYFLVGDSTLYHKLDDFTTNAVTGIRVEAGATLTFGANTDHSSNGVPETASLSLENDLELLGSLRTVSVQEFDNPNDRAAIAIETGGGIFIRPAGVLSTAGDNATTGRGGHGGSIVLSSSYSEGMPGSGIIVNQGMIDASGGDTSDPNGEGGGSAAVSAYGLGLYLYADSRLVNTGTIRADGGDGGSGGHAGGPFGSWFCIAGNETLQNTGPISLSGGTGSNGDGGNGGGLEMAAGESGTGAIHNSGAIATRGGDGTVNGGTGGPLSMYVSGVGDVLNSGAIDARGGGSAGTDEFVAGYGGRGGEINLRTYGGKLLSSGSVEAGGGNVAGTNAESSGGQAGGVYIESSGGEGAPAGALEISGDIFARGGTGPNGGYGGWVYVYYGDSLGTGGIVLRGYSNLVNNGGAGVEYGGAGGGVYLYDEYSGGEPGSGGFMTEADISANGGAADATSGYGGYGGYVDLYTNAPPSQYRGIAVDGGAAANPGDPGWINIDGGGGPG